jgi:predicted phage terminase large subunit-like protein
MSKNLNLSAGELLAWKKARWLARFDLVYLCNEILGYVDVSNKVHGGLIKTLQQFPKPTREQFEENDIYANNKWTYKPIHTLKEFVALPGKRRRLILDSRGHLKTTINCQAHTVQWLLNYPDAAIHIIQSNLDKGNMIVDEIRDHFRYNPKLRQVFPELCPQRSINDFGKVGQFDIRKLYDITSMRKEPSVLAGSIDKGTAGLHFDVMKFSDIVDPNNCFGDQLEKVAKSFYMAENLLVAPSYWIDVEGTRYNFGDVYGKLIESYETAKKQDREPEYAMYVRACFERDTGTEPPKYTPEEQALPFKKDEKGKRIPVWGERFPLQKLEEMERTDPTIFSAQQLNFPIGGLDGQILFPVDPKDNYPALISEENYKQNVRISNIEISVDTAETIGGRSDYTSMSVCAWAKSGRAYIVDILHGKFLPDQIVSNLFFLYAKWNKSKISPVTSIKIEETGFVRGLNAAIGREEEIRKMKLPLQFIKRDTSLSKTERILKTLQPWYVNREIRFLDNIPALEALKKELIQFPNSPHDDILDSLADFFNGKEYFGRTEARPEPHIYKDKSMEIAYGLISPWDDDFANMQPNGIPAGNSRIPW